MWEHVPLAWVLISLATSENTQKLLLKRSFFVCFFKESQERLRKSWLFGSQPWILTLVKNEKGRTIQRSLWKRIIIPSESVHHDSRCSACSGLAASFSIHKGKKFHKCAISTGCLLKSSIRAQIQCAECLVLSFMIRTLWTMKPFPGQFPHSISSTWTFESWRTSRMCGIHIKNICLIIEQKGSTFKLVPFKAFVSVILWVFNYYKLFKLLNKCIFLSFLP